MYLYPILINLQQSPCEILIDDMIDKTLPSGTYIIDKACGRGKTTEIFDFIFLHYNEGVL